MENNKSIVRLREKKLKDGVTSLYLDIYLDGFRSYEYLRMYLNPGKDPATRAQNKATIEAARMIQAKRLVEINNNQAGITREKGNIKFTDYFTEYYRENPRKGDSFQVEINYILCRWIDYAGEDVKLNRITPEMLEGFIRYLRRSRPLFRKRKVRLADGSTLTSEEVEKIVKHYFYTERKSFVEIAKITGIPANSCQFAIYRIVKKTPKPLAESTVDTYYTKVATVLGYAYRKKHITMNPAACVDKGIRPKTTEHERAVLTIDEVRRLAEAPCTNEELKRMFLFACFTGLRLSDVENLRWSQIDDTRVQSTQVKTGKPVYIPLSGNARRWLPERGNPDDFVFTGYPKRTNMSRHIGKWCKNAGIEKHITFHCSRHTFATLTLEYGADLYTISNLLGHTSVKTTSIYARIVDAKKTEAVNLVPEV